jgi:probable rRNA maturation factor
MIEVLYNNKTRTPFTLDEFLPTITSALKKHGITDNVVLELNIVGSQTMRRLNNDFRHKDYATDVLSFPIWPNLETIKAQNGVTSLGSIVVCLPVAIRDAAKENETLLEKINFLIDHSLLHLMGFHHEGDE